MIIRTEYGHPLQGVSSILTLAQLKALAVGDNVPGELIQLTDGRIFTYNATSTLTGDDFFVVQPTTGSGRYLLAPGFTGNVAFPVTFNNADASVLATLPANAIVKVGRGYWGEITASFTGGASSAIGLSSSNASYNTKGDLLGGGSGDVAASLTAGTVRPGTIGAKTAAGIFLVGGDTIRFDRITSAFTAGAGNAHLACEVLANPGA